jgi:adenine-specific DNA-methyltransferase
MATRRSRSSKATSQAKKTETYKHPEAELLLRPEVGTQAQFRKKKSPKTYRYDSSISPALEWDGQNAARNLGEWLITKIEEASVRDSPHTFSEPQQFKNSEGAVVATVIGLQDAIEQLKRVGRPFLNWAGKAERLSFDVPTLPLFVHERLSTKAILETLKGHKRDRQFSMFDLFGTEQHSISDQVLRAYEHKDNWTNRMILGDSLVVMNSLLQYEGLGGQVQMIYMDPPYGVSFGSNFQPFVRKRDVKHNDDADMTREPEMVQAYRDTWELGLHSYLTYMRDRLLLGRELLAPSGSIFVQISDENLHHVRELMDEVFGSENFVVTILLKKKGGQKGSTLDPINDYILWSTKNKEAAKGKIKKLFTQVSEEELSDVFRYVELPDGREVTLSELGEEKEVDYKRFPRRVEVDFPGARLFASENLTSGGLRRTQSVIFRFREQDFDPGIAKGNCWKHSAMTDDGSPCGLDLLAQANRLFVGERQLRHKRYSTDFGFSPVTNWWDEFGGVSNPLYVVQTNTEAVKRCLLMTTNPGDLIIDPTCGSGTTAFVAEQWGRRWITVDTSRVPLALARQRLLSATYAYYELKDQSRGPAGGFSYQRRQNKRGEEVGGIVPHITSSTIANDEPPAEEVLVDRPSIDSKITRVTGPFCFEATIPTPIDWEGDGIEDSGAVSGYGDFVARMLEVLRRSPVLRLDGGKTITLKNVRPPAKTLSLSAEATVDATAPGQSATLSDAYAEADEKNKQLLPLSQKLIALVFGPENGAVSEKLVFEAAKEASGKNYAHLYVIGFAIQPNARKLIEDCEAAMGIAATYIQATPDLMMGDLLKNMRSSQIFSVCGLPEVRVNRQEAKDAKKESNGQMYEVELVGLDVFDPATMETLHRGGNDVPAWFLDTDYNGLVFHVSQAFFPRTSAWDDLKRTLKTEFEESVWEHLAGTTSAPFEAGENAQVAVKVIDDRGNELLVVKSLREVK